jgi:hypothetical protein
VGAKPAPDGEIVAENVPVPETHSNGTIGKATLVDAGGDSR